MNTLIERAKDSLDLLIAGVTARITHLDVIEQQETMKKLFAALKEEISDWEGPKE